MNGWKNKNIKILIIGSSGKLGSQLKKKLNSLNFYTVLCPNKSDINLFNHGLLLDFLKKTSPDIIINAAAITNVDIAESFPIDAFIINASSLTVISKYAYHNNILLIYYSTNYVFNGEKLTLYNETDETNPINVYGYSKLAGEKEIIKSKCDYLIFRFGWLISNNGTNLVTKIIDNIKRQSDINIFYNQLGIPTDIDLIINVTIMAINNYQKENIGIYNISNKGKTDIYNLTMYIYTSLKKFGINLPEKKINLLNHNNMIIRRPKNSCLNHSKLKKLMNINIPSWKIGVNKIITSIKNNTL